MFKAIVLSGFIFGTAVTVQSGYQTLLTSLDSYMSLSYGVLAETDNPELKEEGAEISKRYRSVRSNY